MSTCFCVRHYARSSHHRTNEIQWLITLCFQSARKTRCVLSQIIMIQHDLCNEECAWSRISQAVVQFPRASRSIPGRGGGGSRCLGYHDNSVFFFFKKQSIHKLNIFPFKECSLIVFERIWGDCAAILRKYIMCSLFTYLFNCSSQDGFLLLYSLELWLFIVVYILNKYWDIIYIINRTNLFLCFNTFWLTDALFNMSTIE